MKPDGSLRICGNYKLTVNPEIISDWYPLPSLEELFASLSGATIFSKLDLSDAYHQVELDDDAKKLLVINTHRGLFKYNRHRERNPEIPHHPFNHEKIENPVRGKNDLFEF